MTSSANVRSLHSIGHFKGSLVRFQEEAGSALAALRQDINRFLDWIEHDRPAYWRQETRRAFDAVSQARSELARKQVITVAGHRAECVEEKQALAAAKRRLETAQKKSEIVRQWNIKAHDAADEHSAAIGRLDQFLENDVPKMIALLERMLSALEAYAESKATNSESGSSGDG
jgi:hypothetical protein